MKREVIRIAKIDIERQREKEKRKEGNLNFAFYLKIRKISKDKLQDIRYFKISQIEREEEKLRSPENCFFILKLSGEKIEYFKRKR